MNALWQNLQSRYDQESSNRKIGKQEEGDDSAVTTPDLSDAPAFSWPVARREMVSVAGMHHSRRLSSVLVTGYSASRWRRDRG